MNTYFTSNNSMEIISKWNKALFIRTVSKLFSILRRGKEKILIVGDYYKKAERMPYIWHKYNR